MPVWLCYLFHDPYPARLYYRDVVVALEVVNRPILHRELWVLQARKLTIESKPIDLAETIYGLSYLDVVLYRGGFEHADDTPSARLMASLVRAGYAEVIPHKR